MVKLKEAKDKIEKSIKGVRGKLEQLENTIKENSKEVTAMKTDHCRRLKMLENMMDTKQDRNSTII